MTEQQLKLLSNLKSALIPLIDEAIEDDNFNNLLGNLNVFNKSIDEVIAILNNKILGGI